METTSATERHVGQHPLPVAGVLDEAQAEELAVLVKALADPVRLRLVSIMRLPPERSASAICRRW